MSETMSCENLVECDWALSDRQTSQFGEGGSPAVLIKGEPFWQVRLKYLYARRADRAKFLQRSAQMQRLDGGATEITLFRAPRQNPQNFDASGGVTFSTFSTDVGTRQISLDVGTNLDVGDMIAYDALTSGRFVAEISEVVSRVGTLGVFKTRPRVLTNNGTPNAAVYQASGSFRLMSGGLTIKEPVGLGPMEIVANFQQVSPYG